MRKELADADIALLEDIASEIDLPKATTRYILDNNRDPFQRVNVLNSLIHKVMFMDEIGGKSEEISEWEKMMDHVRVWQNDPNPQAHRKEVEEEALPQGIGLLASMMEGVRRKLGE